MFRSTLQHAIPRQASYTDRKREDTHLLDSREATGPVQRQIQGKEVTISSDALTEFQRIYRQEYGAELTPEEALIKAQQLIELFRILLRPPH